MYFKTMLLLLFAGVVVGEPSDCKVRAEMKCGKRPWKGISDTAEKLKAHCKLRQEFVKCNADFYGTCNTTVDLVPYEYRYLENVKKGCNEHSENYKVISRNIGCISPSFDKATEICLKLKGFQPEAEIFQNSISLSTPEEMRKEAYYCGIVLSIQSCSSIFISKLCGEDVQKPVADMHRRFSRYFNYICSDDMVDRIEPHLAVFEELIKAKMNTRK